jgi:hypothetical protein
LPELPVSHRAAYAHGQRSGAEGAAAKELVRNLGPWFECLVWVRQWGVWPSGEDWPAFYAWRGALGERRSLEIAPGHRFDASEGEVMRELVQLVMENAWDADVLCVVDGRADRVGARISHDEWFEILGSSSARIPAG